MTSQTDIEHTSFLEDCITRKRTTRDIYEALDLYCETAETRKDPVFVKADANKLQKDIKNLAQSFRESYRNDEKTLLVDLVKDSAFIDEVGELGQRYGPLLWSKAGYQPSRYGGQQASTQELRWEDEADQKFIRFHIRCWIIGHVIRAPVSRKGKGRASTTMRDVPENEQSDLENPQTPPRQETETLSDLPFRAPEVPRMLSHAERPNAEPVTIEAGPLQDTYLDSSHRVETRSPQTPNKRKAPSFPEQSASGKLQRVTKETLGSKSSPRARQRDVYSGPRSPEFMFPAQKTQREETCDTAQAYMPPRDVTVETETVFDPDEIMADEQELLLDTNIANGERTSPIILSPTPGPSGTYRNPRRQDSVVPSIIQHDTDLYDVGQALHKRPGTVTLTSIPSHQTDVSTLDEWQVGKLRKELFKLLLSYLNNINQFNPDSYEAEEEEKMNNLLYQFWIHDADWLRAKFGAQFAELQATWQRWMNMRYMLTEFQCTTGFFGKPGDEWKEHLRGMDRVAHAKASIAFVDLKSCVSANENLEGKFDDDLAVVFDLLTKVEGCNGVEEFGALRVYNDELREWFL